jgi:hypothetical protein
LSKLGSKTSILVKAGFFFSSSNASSGVVIPGIIFSQQGARQGIPLSQLYCIPLNAIREWVGSTLTAGAVVADIFVIAAVVDIAGEVAAVVDFEVVGTAEVAVGFAGEVVAAVVAVTGVTGAGVVFARAIVAGPVVTAEVVGAAVTGEAFCCSPEVSGSLPQANTLSARPTRIVLILIKEASFFGIKNIPHLFRKPSCAPAVAIRQSTFPVVFRGGY